MKRLLAALILILSIPPTTIAQPPAPREFSCEGFAVDAGQRTDLKASTGFSKTRPNESLAELSFSFSPAPEKRMNLQIRALAPTDSSLQVAATFIAISTAPLGKVESAFFEKVYPSTQPHAYKIEKRFTNLELHLTCTSSL